MQRLSLIFALAAPLLLGTRAPFACAQPLPDDGPPPHEGGHPRGPHHHGPKGRLDHAWHEAERLERGPNELSKAQARQLVSLVKPWAVRPTMSDMQAGQLAQKVEAVTGVSPNRRPPREEGHEGPPRGDEWGGRPPRDGDGPPPRHRPHTHTPPPADYNPFYAPTGRADWKTLPSGMQQFLARRYRENRLVLEKLSHRAAN